jgi:hypothetical protein
VPVLIVVWKLATGPSRQVVIVKSWYPVTICPLIMVTITVLVMFTSVPVS